MLFKLKIYQIFRFWNQLELYFIYYLILFTKQYLLNPDNIKSLTTMRFNLNKTNYSDDDNDNRGRKEVIHWT